MRLLVLGGTAQLGRAIAERALRDGHDVTCLARGRAGAVPAGARAAVADRTQPEAFAEVAAQRWDAVIELTSQPGQAQAAAAALAGCAAHAVVVSSISVYRDAAEPGQDERAAVAEPLAAAVLASPQDYAAAKAAVESHWRQACGEARVAIVRPGLIAGPGDLSDRSGYYVQRCAEPCDARRLMLVPDVPAQPVQLIDARDLAAWCVALAAARRPGVFDAVGEAHPLDDHLRQVAQVARAAGAGTAALVPAPPEWLAAEDVTPWAGPRSLPLWLPPEAAGLMARRGRAAVDAGLVRRPLRDTLADTLAWERGRTRPHLRRAGLDPADESELLDRRARR